MKVNPRHHSGLQPSGLPLLEQKLHTVLRRIGGAALAAADR
jgi:hypothetical protein